MKPRIALCPKCHASMTPGERFCRQCGAVICPNCQELLPQRSRYCPRCGFLCLNEPVREPASSPMASVIPRAASASSQSFTPPRVPQSGSPSPSFSVSQRPPTIQSQVSTPASVGRAVCPQCGSVIDIESGKCSGCGLLYGAKHRAVQTASSGAPPPRYMPPEGMRPQPEKVPTPPPTGVTRNVPVTNRGTGYDVPPQMRPPISAYQTPAASVAAVSPGTSFGGYGTPSVPRAQRYRSRELVEEAGVPDRLRRTLLKMMFAVLVLFVLFFAGAGLYYVFSQADTEMPAMPSPATPAAEVEPAPGPSSPSASVPRPVISEVAVARFTDKTAIITWKTDKPATSQVRYGKTEACGLATEETKSLVTEHSVRLSGLEPNTTYYFKVVSKDASDRRAELMGEAFTTKAPLPVGTNVGNRAPDFTLKSIDGKSVTLSGLQGKKVILNFWAVWCEPCKKEMPYIQEVHEAWSDKGVVVLAVAVNQNQYLDGVKLYITDNKYSFTVLFDAEGKARQLYQVSEIPKTVFIDEDGIVRHVRLGDFASQQQIEDILTSF